MLIDLKLKVFFCFPFFHLLALMESLPAWWVRMEARPAKDIITILMIQLKQCTSALKTRKNVFIDQHANESKLVWKLCWLEREMTGPNILTSNCSLLEYGLQWSVTMCLNDCQKHDLKLSHPTVHLCYSLCCYPCLII